jgi:hypothetical protein
MDSHKNSNDRRLSDPFSCRYYEDNYDQLLSISEATGRKLNEVARDLMDDALRRYQSAPEADKSSEIMQKLDYLIEQNRLATGRHEQLLQRHEELEDQNARLKAGLIQNLREFYSIILESLSASIGARRLTWNYVAHTVLKQSGYSDEQIKQRYDAEKKAWIEEKDRIADYLEEAISKMQSQPGENEPETDKPF